MSRPSRAQSEAAADERDTRAIANFFRSVLRDDVKPHATAKRGVLKRKPSGKPRPKAR
jgi:hypothetical protein